MQGYSDHVFDMQLLTVHAGFWSRYYNTKRPKPLHYILNKLVLGRSKTKDVKGNEPIPEVDVDAFLAREARFKNRMMEVNSTRAGLD